MLAAAEDAASEVEALDATVEAGRGVVDAKRMDAAFRIKVFVCESRRAVYDVPGRDARFLERSPWARCCAGVEENWMAPVSNCQPLRARGVYLSSCHW